MSGAIMQRIMGLVLATVAFSSLSGGPAVADVQSSIKVRIKDIRVDNLRSDQARRRGPPVDVTTLLTAARGAPAVVCVLATKPNGHWNWGGWNDAPATPLSAAKVAITSDDFKSEPMPASDLQQLYAGLSSDDGCVR